MINALHLLWMIPLAAFFGIFLAAMLHAAGDADRWSAQLLEKE